MLKAINFIKWPGGKFYLTKFILAHIPEHKIYVEPFGGGASVLINKQKSDVEVYNDIYFPIYCLFFATKDAFMFERLKHKLYFTLRSFEEYKKATELLNNSDDILELAWAIFVAVTQSHSGMVHKTNWGRFFKSNMSTAWVSALSRLDLVHNRIRNVLLHNEDAFSIIEKYDSRDTFFYLDPPYPKIVRSHKKLYRHEFEDHERLLKILREISGKFIISSYDNSLYDEYLLPLCKKYSKNSYARCGMIDDNGKFRLIKRLEVIYVKE
jgi:DNA adenine methylase